MKLTIANAGGAPAGTHDAVFLGVEEKINRSGDPYLRWSFEIDVVGPVGEPREVAEVGGISSTKTGPSSKAFAWLTAILGRRPVPGEDIEAGDLVGSPCIIVVEVNAEGFSNVVDIRPRNQSGTA